MNHSELDTLVGEIAGIRPLPPVAARVLAITESEHFSAHELAQAISSDPALTATVLHLANSAYYGFPRRIGTVRDAVVLLGFRAVRSATLAACVMETMPKGRTLDSFQFWRHAVTVALLAEVIAEDRHEHTGEAFTAGILHNIGRLALDQARPDALHRCAVLAREEGITLPDAERVILGFTDAEVGGAMALQWNFPANLAIAVAQHQRPLESLEGSHHLAVIVAQARAVALAAGVTDGLERPAGVATAAGDAAPLNVARLEDEGGLDAIVRRATAFMDTAGVGL